MVRLARPNTKKFQIYRPSWRSSAGRVKLLPSGSPRTGKKWRASSDIPLQSKRHEFTPEREYTIAGNVIAFRLETLDAD
jgi:hypothetical protein